MKDREAQAFAIAARVCCRLEAVSRGSVLAASRREVTR